MGESVVFCDCTVHVCMCVLYACVDMCAPLPLIVDSLLLLRSKVVFLVVHRWQSQVQSSQLQLSKGQSLDHASVRSLLLNGFLGNPYPRISALYIGTESGLFMLLTHTQPAPALPYAKYWITCVTMSHYAMIGHAHSLEFLTHYS